MMTKTAKAGASKSGPSTEKKSNKRKRKSNLDVLLSYTNVFHNRLGKETYSIYIYKVLKQVRRSIVQSISKKFLPQLGPSRYRHFEQSDVHHEQFCQRHFR